MTDKKSAIEYPAVERISSALLPEFKTSSTEDIIIKAEIMMLIDMCVPDLLIDLTSFSES